jgi:hypothetical protein
MQHLGRRYNTSDSDIGLDEPPQIALAPRNGKEGFNDFATAL